MTGSINSVEGGGLVGTLLRVVTPRNSCTLLVWLIVFTHLVFRDLVFPILSEASWVFTAIPCLKGSFLEPEEEWEDNQPYFDSIDSKILRERINEAVLKPSIINEYSEALKRRGHHHVRRSSMGDKGDEEGHEDHHEDERLIRFGNLETYDINGNKDYAHAFALDSQIVRHSVRQSEKRKTERFSSQSTKAPKRSSIKNFMDGMKEGLKDLASDMQDGALDALDAAKAGKKAAEEEARELKEKAKRRASAMHQHQHHSGEHDGETFSERMKHWKEEHTTNPLH